MSGEAGGGASVITTICAVGGLFIGLVGTGLSIYNLIRARNKEKREEEIRGEQRLVRAEYRKVQGRQAKSLYLVAAKPVNDLIVHFDNGDTFDTLSLGPDQPILVKEFYPYRGEKRYFTANIIYMTEGCRHEYKHNIPFP